MTTAFGRTVENWYTQKLANQTAVDVMINGEVIKGIICGIASEPVPVSGRTYIVDIGDQLPEYGYSHIAISEMFLQESIEELQTSEQN